MTPAAGARFGLVTGALLVSFASSIGATLAFFASRLLFHDSVQRRFGDKLKAINVGGNAKVIDPWAVEISLHDGATQQLTTRNIIIASGALFVSC